MHLRWKMVHLLAAVLLVTVLSGCQLFKRDSGAPTPTPTFPSLSPATEAPVSETDAAAPGGYPDPADGNSAYPYPQALGDPAATESAGGAAADPYPSTEYNPYPGGEPGASPVPATGEAAYPGPTQASQAAPTSPTASLPATQAAPAATTVTRTATTAAAPPAAATSASATAGSTQPGASATPGASLTPGAATPTQPTPPTPTPFDATPTATPSPTPTPTATPVPLTDRMIASDPRTFKLASGGVQFVEFFAYWCLPCLQMAPVVHGLEDEFGDEIHFVYLDIDNPLVKPFQRELGFSAAPEYYLLDEKGKVLAKWTGLVELDEFEADIRDATR